MKKDKRSRFLMAIFASAMLGASPANATDTVTDGSVLLDYLQDSIERRIILGNDISISSSSNLTINLGAYKTIKGLPDYTSTESKKTLTIDSSGDSILILKPQSSNGLAVEYLKLTKAQILGTNAEIQLTGSEFDNCATSETLYGSGGAIYNDSGTVKSLTKGNVFKNNNVSYYGGAILNGGAGKVEISVGDKFEANRAYSGGAIYNIGDLNIDTNSSDPVIFTNNKADYSGGAIDITFGAKAGISNAKFEGNSAGFAGGAISNRNSSSAYIYILNSQFNGNFISNYYGLGGAIANFDDSSLVLEDSSFTGNYVSGSSYGGAIYNNGNIGLIAKNGSFILKENESQNEGGAIYNNYALALQKKNNNQFLFDSNKAESGGAIYNSFHTEISGGVEFKNNIATISGGAIYNSNTLDFLHEGALFADNRAEDGDGGAIYNDLDARFDAIDTKISFSGNYAKSSGGAIYNAGATTISSAKFENNKSDENGGAIYNRKVLKLDGNAQSGGFEFTGNRAEDGDGGAIYNTANATISYAKFNSNYSAVSGGAIYNSDTINISNAEFENNTSDEDGGAIYNAANATISNVSFYTNTATDRGGAIYIDSDSTINISKSVFSGNSITDPSISQGGAIYNLGADSVVNIVDSSFTSNEAVEGGAIYNRGNLTITAKDSEINFMDNRATNGGAIYNAAGSRDDANVYIVAEGG